MSIVSKICPYFFPSNPIDQTLGGRFKRGLINYASVASWWTIKPIQNWIKRRDFDFHHKIDGKKKTLRVSGADPTHLWVANEVLLEKVYDLSLVTFTPDLIYDFGANIGLFSMIAATRWPGAKVISVEPHPTTAQFLAANLRINGVSAAILQCAVDAVPGVKFLQNQGAVFQELTETHTDTFTLCLGFDSLMVFSGEQRVLIKMDIEGSEEVVLKGFSKKLPPDCFIYIELHRGDASVQWVNKWATQHGFRFIEVRRRELAIDGYLLR